MVTLCGVMWRDVLYIGVPEVTDTAQPNIDAEETMYVALSAAVGVYGGLVVGIVATVLLMRKRQRKGV